MLVTGLLFIMCCSVAFDGVLGGVMGIVCSVVFGVLSSFLWISYEMEFWEWQLVAVTHTLFFQDNNALL